MIWSRAKIGKRRWAWAQWKDFESLVDRDPLDAGYSETEPHLDGDYYGTWSALSWHKQQVKQRKAQRPAKETNVQPVEYLYYWTGWGDSDQSPPEWIAVPILRKTKKRVFVQYHGEHTVALDREKLERD